MTISGQSNPVHTVGSPHFLTQSSHGSWLIVLFPCQSEPARSAQQRTGCERDQNRRRDDRAPVRAIVAVLGRIDFNVLARHAVGSLSMAIAPDTLRCSFCQLCG